MLHPIKGQAVKIAQGAMLGEYSKKEKTLYIRETVNIPTLAIYVRQFSEYNDSMCEVIIGDKILYTSEKDLRDV